jgi:hypothetical protein
LGQLERQLLVNLWLNCKIIHEFIELLRGKTAVDKLSPRMRRVPFNIKIPSQTGASTVGWVGEGKRKPTKSHLEVLH